MGNLPTCAVLPDKVPLAAKSTPVGSVPLASANVNGAVAPICVNAALNSVLTVAELFAGLTTSMCLQQSETLLPERVTAPSSTSARPERLAPVPKAIPLDASTLPMNAVPSPIVACPFTCQNTFPSHPPLMTRTAAPGAVVRPPAG